MDKRPVGMQPERELFMSVPIRVCHLLQNLFDAFVNRFYSPIYLLPIECAVTVAGVEMCTQDINNLIVQMFGISVIMD